MLNDAAVHECDNITVSMQIVNYFFPGLETNNAWKRLGRQVHGDIVVITSELRNAFYVVGAAGTIEGVLGVCCSTAQRAV